MIHSVYCLFTGILLSCSVYDIGDEALVVFAVICVAVLFVLM